MLSFDHKMHVRLSKESSILAKQYRIDCGLEKAESKKVIIKKEVPVIETIIEKAPVIEDRVEYSRDDLKVMLSEAEIKFFNWAKTEALLEICIRNELI